MVLNAAITFAGIILLGFIYSFSQNQLHDGVEIKPINTNTSSQPVLAKDIYLQNPIENIKVDEYEVTIDNKEVDKRIDEIAKNQKNFVEVDAAKVANEGDLVVFDYKATVDGKEFKGSEGKNTQLELGKDLFIKGFDKQLIKAKKDEIINVEVNLPENFPEKELTGKKAIFECKITAVKKSKEVKVDDEFAKNLGAKDLIDLKKLISKQINDEYKNSLEALSKNQILKELEKFKVSEIPENLIEQEVKVLSGDMKEDEIKKNKKNFEETANESEAKKKVANWVINNVLAVLNERDLKVAQCPVSPTKLASIIKMVESGKISNNQAKEIFAVLFDNPDKDPDAIITELGFEPADSNLIESIVEEVVSNNPEKVKEIQEGNDKLINWLTGQVMKASKGKANPKIIGDLLRKKIL